MASRAQISTLRQILAHDRQADEADIKAAEIATWAQAASRRALTGSNIAAITESSAADRAAAEARSAARERLEFMNIATKEREARNKKLATVLTTGLTVAGGVIGTFAAPGLGTAGGAALGAGLGQGAAALLWGEGPEVGVTETALAALAGSRRSRLSELQGKLSDFSSSLDAVGMGG